MRKANFDLSFKSAAGIFLFGSMSSAETNGTRAAKPRGNPALRASLRSFLRRARLHLLISLRNEPTQKYASRRSSNQISLDPISSLLLDKKLILLLQKWLI